MECGSVHAPLLLTTAELLQEAFGFQVTMATGLSAFFLRWYQSSGPIYNWSGKRRPEDRNPFSTSLRLREQGQLWPDSSEGLLLSWPCSASTTCQEIPVFHCRMCLPYEPRSVGDSELTAADLWA